MALADGDPAEAGDIWLRAVTDERYWKPDGILHNRAFSGSEILGPPVAPGRSWSLELSGWLLSLIEGLETKCTDFVAFGAADKFVIRDWLQDILHVARPDGLAVIEALRRRPAG